MNPRHLLVALLLALPLSSVGFGADGARKPNVLFLAIDDQNDWIGPLGGHPLAKTPHLDGLARRGTVLANAHCQATLCNPSRTSLMLGLRPTTTGIYGLAPWFRNVEAWRDRVTLPQHFKAHGYTTYAAGKVYHGAAGGPAARGQEFDVWGPAGGVGAKPAAKLIPATPMGNNPLMDWGVFPHRDEDKGDYIVASWAIEKLRAMPKDQPFFLAAGFFLPHVPCYATPAWFDLYPDNDTILPVVREDDRAAYAAVLVVSALEITRAPAALGAREPAVAKPGALVSGVHQLRRRPDRTGAGRLGVGRFGRQHRGRGVGRSWIPLGRERHHGKEHALGARHPRAPDFRRARGGARRSGLVTGGAA